MKMLLKLLPFLFCYTLLFSSCTGEKDAKYETPQIEIPLNDLVIIDEELNISYQVPQSWNEMPADLSEKMVARLDKKGENEFIVYTPKSFYFNNAENSLLRVGQIQSRKNHANDSLSIESYVILFKKFNNDLDIENIKLKNNNFPIVQMKIIKKNLMSFKYLFKNHNENIIQFDFSIKTEDYSRIHPLIIASINSLKLL
jgi:hypothetical protein